MTASDALFRPFRCKTLELANRIVMAPMTRMRAPDGVPGTDRFSLPGVGLLHHT